MPPEELPFPYDVSASLYDEDMAENAPQGDADFYVRECVAAGSPVLELGAGTGRITFALLRAGCSVTALDRSRAMLDVLEQKAGGLAEEAIRRLTVVHADMREIEGCESYAAILCPYSAFAYLLTDADRAAMLAGVRRSLRAGGSFVLDVFIPDPAASALPEGRVVFDYRRPRADGTFLEREKTLTPDVTPGVTVIERRYRISSADGAEIARFVTTSRVRPWHPDALRAELEKGGWSVLDVVLDFGRAAPGASPKTAVFRCRAR